MTVRHTKPPAVATPFTCEALARLGLMIPDVRFEDEIVRYEAADRASRPAPGGILFVGDSDIRRWDDLAAHFDGLPVLNRGFGGARSWEVLLYFHRVVAPYRPRTIVYCAGDNDIACLQAGGVATAVTGFRLFRDTVAARLPDTRRILYLAIHPSPCDELLWPFIREANAAIRDLCRASGGLAVFTDYLHLLDAGAGRPRIERFAPDRLHFTAAFYKDLAAFLRPGIENAYNSKRESKHAQD